VIQIWSSRNRLGVLDLNNQKQNWGSGIQIWSSRHNSGDPDLEIKKNRIGDPDLEFQRELEIQI